MKRRTKSLTATEVLHAKAKDKNYVMYDGAGLGLHIQESGSKIWRFRYTSKDKIRKEDYLP